MKAEMSVDPRLFALLGRKLYTSNPVVIAIRELLQNSRDACIRAGVEPDISFVMEYDDATESVRISCSDNGCGMSEEEIVGKFLCLGGTSKTGTQESGRFGVAKVALMCGSYWFVHTLSSTLDSDTVLRGDDIGVALNRREGTLIEIEYKDVGGSYSWLTQSIEMLAFSDVSVKFCYKRNGAVVNEGLLGGLPEKVELISQPQWTGYAIQEMKIFDSTYRGGCYVRLNGLVQHKRFRYGSEALQGNLIVDLDSSLSPDDKNFPMVMSREKLIQPVEGQVNEWHSFHSRNASTTDILVRRKITNAQVSFTKGRLYVGRRGKTSVDEQLSELADKNLEKAKVIESWLGTAGYDSANLTEESGLSEFYDEDSKFPLLRLFDYSPNPDDVELDSRFIVAWALILEEIIPEGIRFGVGIMGGDEISAEMTEVEGVKFFCINPREFLTHFTMDASIICLWQKACHVCAHLSVNDHDERYTSTIEYLTEATIDPILAKTREIGKILRGISG